VRWRQVKEEEIWGGKVYWWRNKYRQRMCIDLWLNKRYWEGWQEEKKKELRINVA
jgi:hypothetical protein